MTKRDERAARGPVSTDIELYVERLARVGGWEDVEYRSTLIRRTTRRIFPTGKLTEELLRVGETTLMLSEGPLPNTWHVPDRYWMVDQDYRLFSRLSGMRPKDGYPPLALARGFPTDASHAVYSTFLSAGRTIIGADPATPRPRPYPRRGASWLTLAEMSPLRHQFPRFRESVLDLMAFVSPDPTRIRAVFWYD